MFVPREAALTRLLDPLPCATLQRLAGDYGLKLPRRARKSELIAALVSYDAVEHNDVLALLAEDELRLVCEKLGLLIGGGRPQLRQRLRRALRWLPFTEARELLHWIGLRTAKEYHAWSKRGGRPPGVPSNPPEVYRDAGWSGWGDFLGTGRVANKDLPFRSFEAAREYARSLGLKGLREWNDFARGKLPGLTKPADIPAHP